ncbi:MAG TPA: RebB family R body protein [Rhizomicrobium sp.]|nr:RebB family R body protein [Rhizomicrobium sp.]
MAATVNSQITDAVTQANVKVVGESPAEAVAVEVQAMAHSTSLAMENATATQGGMQQVNNTATAAMISLITQA